MSQKNKKSQWDGKSRVANDTYRKRFDEIFNQAREFIYGQKENEELAESYKESRRQQKERDNGKK